MTPNAKKLVSAIKAGQAHLGWDDVLYRQTLQRLTGKTSATKCSFDELQKVKEYMHEAGFPRRTAKRHGRRPLVNADSAGILAKIEALLADADRPWQYAESMARHMFKHEDALGKLSADKLVKLMQALAIDAKRRSGHENHN